MMSDELTFYVRDGTGFWKDKDGRIRQRINLDGFTAYYDEEGDWHCENGPARQGGDLDNPEWFIHGKEMSQEEFERYIKMKAFW
jgi:hypothetical protein